MLSISITSYINNLHPANEKPLYNLIAQLITASIPLWNLTLAPLADSKFRHGKRISYCGEYDPDPENGPSTDGPQQESDEDEDDYDERRWEWYINTRRVVHPEPDGPFSPLPLPPKFDLKERYARRGLQVIVKLANVELTPEKTEYEGGSWHVEGQMARFYPAPYTLTLMNAYRTNTSSPLLSIITLART